jgi:hypothetical protein
VREWHRVAATRLYCADDGASLSRDPQFALVKDSPRQTQLQQASRWPKEAIMVDGPAKTPHYVLKEGSHPTRPRVSQASAGNVANVIYGFSDKPQYDVYVAASELALTPYPLVKGFLNDRMKLDGDSLDLVVLDAVSSTQPCLIAVTFSSVLQSLLLHSESVVVTHRLILDEFTSEYRIEPCSF